MTRAASRRRSESTTYCDIASRVSPSKCVVFFDVAVYQTLSLCGVVKLLSRGSHTISQNVAVAGRESNPQFTPAQRRLLERPTSEFGCCSHPRPTAGSELSQSLATVDYRHMHENNIVNFCLFVQRLPLLQAHGFQFLPSHLGRLRRVGRRWRSNGQALKAF